MWHGYKISHCLTFQSALIFLVSLLTTTVKKSEMKKLNILNKYLSAHVPVLSCLCYVLTSAMLCTYLCCVVRVSSYRFHVTGRNNGQGEEVCHLKFLDLVNTILNDKKFRISRNHFSADKWESIAYFCRLLCRPGFESSAKASHLLGNFKQRSWIRIALKNSPILLQCTRLEEKHI